MEVRAATMDDNDIGDEALQRFLGTTSFGKQSRAGNVEKQIDQSKRVQAVKVNQDTSQQAEIAVQEKDQDDKDEDEDNDDGDDDDDDDEDEDDEDEFPTSHEMLLKTHDRAVTAATIDPSGTRLITGSMDCTLKFLSLIHI